VTELIKTASERDAHLAEVLEQYLEALETGTAPPRAEFLARHPELAEQLEACLASLDFIRRAGTPALPRGANVPPARPGSGTPVPSGTLPANVLTEHIELGDYRILREVGRGGMGIVYEAQERAQGRRVALKVLPFAAALDPRQLQRFKNEAEAARLLQHPHIVPVFAVGSKGDVHYYAMKFVEGRTLAQVIADCRLQMADLRTGPSSAKSAICNLQSAIAVAQFGIQAAEALEQAHQVGIIHRDIKPANLLIEESGHLWVADFGLALFQHDAGGLTLTGDLVGTLRYMSPEQALGKHGIVDQRSDIYSLGVTLYELATLEPAFAGSDRQELLRQIGNDDPVPPRRLNKAIPVALETILLKATAKEPAGRYTTAQELADDLRRFVAGQQIVARRPGVGARIDRWARRHKPLVAGAAVATLAALIVAVVSNIFIERARKEADHRAQQARQAVNEMYTEVAQRWWFQQPYMEQVQREFLLKALAFYEEFSQERGDSASLRLETARAARRVADIQHKLGEHVKAAAAYDLAIAQLKQVAAEFPTEPAYRDELANAHNNQGNLLRDQSRLADAEKAYFLAHELFAALAAEDPKQPDCRDGLAASLNSLGMVQYALGRPVEAEKDYRQSLDVLAGLTKDHPDVPAYQHALASCRNNLANLLRDTNRPRAAQLAYEQALAGWRKLSAQMPGMPIFRQAEAAGHSGLGAVYEAIGRTRGAEQEHHKALSLRERLANEYPGVPAYRQALAASQHSLGRLLAGAGRVEEARTLYSQALVLRKSLAKELPAAPIHRQELADSYQAQAELLAVMARPSEAEQAAREALALRQRLCTEDKDDAPLQFDLARSRHELGTILRGLGHLIEAEDLYRTSAAQSEKLTTAFPGAAAFRLELAAVHNDLATLYQRTSRFAEAEKLHRAALAVREKLAADSHDAPYYRMELAVGQIQLGGLFQDTGRAQESEAAYRQAMAISRKLAADFPSLADYRRQLFFAQQQLGELLTAAGKLPDAEQALRQARPLLDKLAAEFPALPAYREQLARHHHAFGLLFTRTDRKLEAEQAYQQELALREKLAAEFTEDAGLVRDFAYLLANCPEVKLRQPQQAVELAKKAATMNPQDAASQSVLGIAHYRAGDWRAALVVLEQAEKMPGKYEGGPLVLAMAHWRLNDKQKANAWFRQANAWMDQYHPCDEELRLLHGEARTTLANGS